MSDQSEHRIRRRKPGRRRPHLSGKPRILILCEGARTEPIYFNRLKFDRRLTSVVVRPPRARQIGPPGLLKRARNELRNDPGWDEIYCVLDHDGRDSAVGKLEAELTAMNRKRASTQVEMILSDPCFELWLLLHFEFTDRPYTSVRGGRSACADVIERLQRHIPEYRKNTTQYLKLVEGRVSDALSNADQLNRLSPEVQPRRTPYTNVSKLVARLLELAES